MSEKEFIDGLIIKPPHDKAPAFVVCKISIKRQELIAWLQAKEGEWINLDVKRSKGGKMYAEIDNWKPKDGKSSASPPKETATAAGAGKPEDLDDCPF